jgi:hypothetical protein
MRGSIVRVTRPGYEAEALTLQRAMSAPLQEPRLKAYSDFYGRMKREQILPFIEIAYCLAAHDAQAARLNLKSPGSFNASVVSTPTFTTDRGYTPDGAGKYLTTGWNPATQATLFAQNDAHIAAWNRVSGAGNSKFLAGNSGSSGVVVASRFTTDQALTRVNDTGGQVANNGNPAGLCMGNRVSSGLRETWVNGVSKGTVSVASAAPVSAVVLVCATQTSVGVDELAYFSIGRSLAGKEAIYFAIVRDLMQAIGAA